MCGIAGIVNSQSGAPVDAPLVAQMTGQIVHRGPDDEGFYVEGPVGLGMRRLSIIDLHTGSQPIFNEDRSICVVFNGEIYNFQELRAELVSRGHDFHTKSDTEVIVHLYEEEGIDFPRRLNGMFAIALWDGRAERLMLVRDRLGQKPLYYCHQAGDIVFGSELKCLLQCESVPRRLDHQAVYHYFTLGYVPHPFSIYADIKQLPPGNCLVLERGETQVSRYWDVHFRDTYAGSEADARAELRELLSDSVRLRMISDVPLGAFLSGGLDSSITVALMAQQSSTPVKTFHIDFAEPDYSERKYARAVSLRYNTDHYEEVVQPDAVEILDELIGHFDEPFGDDSAIPTWYVSKMTRKHVTVALAGDGGDEAFGGYSRYQRLLARRRLPWAARQALGSVGRVVHRFLPHMAPGRRYFRTLGQDDHRYFAVGAAELETREILGAELTASIPAEATFRLMEADMAKADQEDPLAAYCSLDLHRYLPDDILTKVDRMSMAHSLELRSPFLDYRVIEFAASLPHQWKINGQTTKRILKDTFQADLPDEILQQRKRGFSLPVKDWLRGDLRPALEDSMHDRRIAESGIFRMNQIRALAREHMSGRRDRSEQLWRYLVFVRWWDHHHQQLAGGVSQNSEERTSLITGAPVR